MGKFVDLVGKRFNRLLVVENMGKNKYGTYIWKCLCDCGNYKTAITGNLKNGNTNSCGCLLSESGYRNMKKLKEKPDFYSRRNKNTYEIYDDYAVIIANNKKHRFIVDIEDLEYLKNYCWTDHQGYVFTASKGEKILMHRFILKNVPNGMQIDHINRNKFDNRKNNLRIVYPFENEQNKPVSKNSKTGLKCINKVKNKYLACFTYNKKRYRVGVFNTKEEAYRMLLKKKSEVMEDFEFYANNNAI